MHPQCPTQWWVRTVIFKTSTGQECISHAATMVSFLTQQVSPVLYSALQSSEHYPTNSGLNASIASISQKPPKKFHLAEGPDASASCCSVQALRGWAQHRWSSSLCLANLSPFATGSILLLEVQWRLSSVQGTNHIATHQHCHFSPIW